VTPCFIWINGKVAWNVWKQPLHGVEPEQLTHFNEGRIYFFDQSWDGKTLAGSRGVESRDAVLFGSYQP